jgi:hypothetical protein
MEPGYQRPKSGTDEVVLDMAGLITVLKQIGRASVIGLPLDEKHCWALPMSIDVKLGH